jgi:PPM family protein phosphatase
VSPTETVTRCGSCGAALMPRARFCESCGSPVDAVHAADAADAADAAASRRPGVGTGGGGGGCDRCGGEVGDDGYCTACGFRALEPITVDDRGAWASATHRGKRHERNEDAVAITQTSEGWPVLVVSDGVSVSPNPHLASAAAVEAAARRLADRPFAGEADLEAAVAAAHEAASAIPTDGDPLWRSDEGRPACTIVVAVATDSTVVTANVGDARIHLLRNVEGAWAATQLTSDDSMAARAIAAGADPIEALNAPDGHTLVAWLGGDAPELAAHLATRPAAPGDVVLANSDGLWNYAPTDESLSALANDVLPPPPATDALPGAKVAERLAAWAVSEGGADNVTVALAPVPAGPDTRTSESESEDDDADHEDDDEEGS